MRGGTVTATAISVTNGGIGKGIDAVNSITYGDLTAIGATAAIYGFSIEPSTATVRGSSTTNGAYGRVYFSDTYSTETYYDSATLSTETYADHYAKKLNVNFLPFISVGAQSAVLTYGSAGTATFTVTANNFTTPSYSPSIDWVTTGHDGVTVTVSGTTVTATTTNSATAGEYKFKVKSGTTASSSEVTLLIGKASATTAMKSVSTDVINLGKIGATVTIPTLPSGASYGTATFGGTVSLSAVSISGATLTYTAAASTAGQTGTITLPVNNATNYADYNLVITVTSIAKTAVTINATEVTSSSYTSNAIAGYTGAITVDGNLVDVDELEISYVGTGTTSYSASETAPINVGTYKLTISVADSNASYRGNKTINFSITKATNSFTVPLAANGWRVGGTNNPTATAAFGTPTFTYSITENGTYESAKPTQAGVYWVKATVAETTNYTALEAKREFSITPAYTLEPDINEFLSPVTISDWAYGETPSTPTATAKYGTVVYNYSTLSGKAPTEVGTFTVTATVYGNALYTEITSVATFSIRKAQYDMSKVAFNDLTVMEDGKEHGITVDGALPIGVTVEYVGNGQTNHGVYTVTANFTSSDKNYQDPNPMTAKLQINVAEIDKALQGAEYAVIVRNDKTGLYPLLELIIEVVQNDRAEKIKLKNGEVISKVYDITLKKNGEIVQPNETITVKVLIPNEVKDKEFKLIHVHNGEEKEVAYVIEGNYAVFDTDELSQFIFIVKKDNAAANLTWLWIVLAVILAAVLIAIIIVNFKKRSDKLKKNDL